jgi:intein-encoded DNA endonuclease-like protein
MLHDATERKNTYRIATKNFNFAKIIREGILKLGSKAWIYKEGKNRNLWIVEFSKTLLKESKIKSKQNKIDYIRGYFDAEGGISQSSKVRFYIYFCQKDLIDLKEVKNYLLELGISCGIIHNPSKKVDPNYWRFFVSSKSYKDFARIISSDHPGKIKLLEMKI